MLLDVPMTTSPLNAQGMCRRPIGRFWVLSVKAQDSTGYTYIGPFQRNFRHHLRHI